MKKTRKPIVAIDGPVGVGKSAVAKGLALRLGFIYIDTGAMYRAVTLKAMKEGIDLENQAQTATLAQRTHLQFVRQNDSLIILCNGEDVSEAIRAPEVSVNTSPIADNPAVRERLVALQQEMGQHGGVVMEGRDIGTVVFPHAEIKIYLDAKPEIRAQRRYDQLISQGKNVTLESTHKELLQRDQRDKERPVGALKIADGAIVVDSSYLSEQEVIDKLYQIVLSKT